MRAAHRSNTFVPRATPRPKGTLRAQLYSVFSHYITLFCEMQVEFCRDGGRESTVLKLIWFGTDAQWAPLQDEYISVVKL